MGIILVFLIIVFSLVLIKASDLIIVAVRRIAKEVNTSVFKIAAIILALGTSLPELFVGITSALEKEQNLSLGVVLGSNIANTALIGGVSALLVGHVFVRGEYLRKDFLISFVAGILPLFLLLDGTISRVDSLILIMVYLAYSTGFFKSRFEEIGKEQMGESFVFRFMREFKHIESVKARELGRLFLGISLLIFSSDMIVKFSTQLGKIANIDIFLIGLFVLAIGTSLPELVFSVRSLENHQPSMFFGNLLGSTITNSTLIIGITTLISPVVELNLNEYLIAAISFLVIFSVFWIFTKSKNRLDRWEAFILLLFYVGFLILEFR